MSKEKIWCDDINSLITKDNYYKCIPKKDESKNEKINAIVRLSIVIAILLGLYYKDWKFGFIIIGALFITYFLKDDKELKNNNDDKDRQKDESKKENKNTEVIKLEDELSLKDLDSDSDNEILSSYLQSDIPSDMPSDSDSDESLDIDIKIPNTKSKKKESKYKIKNTDITDKILNNEERENINIKFSVDDIDIGRKYCTGSI